MRTTALSRVAAAALVLCAGTFTASAQTLSLESLFDYVENVSTDAAIGDLTLDQARREYDRQRAIVYPTIDISAPVSYGTTLMDRYTNPFDPTTEVEHTGGYSIGLSPTLSIVQALPTGGSVSASLGDTLSFSDPGTFDPESAGASLPVNDRPDHTLSVGLGFDQPLYFGGSSFTAALATAENSWTRSVLTHERTRNQLRLDAAQRYFQIQYLGYSLELVTARHDAAVARQESMEQEANLGIITESALLQARLATSRAALDLLDARRARDQAMTEFRALYGIPAELAMGSRVQTVQMPSVDPVAAAEDGLTNNPDLRMLRLASEDSANAIVIFDSGRAPRLSVGLDFTYADTSEEDDTNRSTGLRGSVAVSANLFDGRADRNRREELLLESTRARVEADRAADDFRRQVSGLFDDLDRSAVYREYLAAALDAAEYEAVRGRRDNELGVITDRDLLDLELALESARLEIARSTVDDNMLKLRLLLTLGRPVSDAQVAPEESVQ